jgi:hypothetical protein
MNYKQFMDKLAEQYDNWDTEHIKPKNTVFKDIFNGIGGFTTENNLQMLNFAVKNMQEGEYYCEVGTFRGTTLVGALYGNNCKGFSVDNFAEFDENRTNYNKLMENIKKFGVKEQVLFNEQDFREFFRDFPGKNPGIKFGVYLYDGAHDYQSQLDGLELAKPFLADNALIFVDDTNWEQPRKANEDFIKANPNCKLLMDIKTNSEQSKTFWNGVQVILWEKP